MGGPDLGTSMPAWLLYPATLLCLLILAYPFYRSRSVIGRYALFALCFRYLASAHHAFTFKASPIGLSWNALGSSAVFLGGLLLIQRRHLALKPMIPFYILIASVVMSGLVNRDIPGVVDVVVKFGYLAIITISVYEGLCALGEKRMMNLLLWSAIIPVLFQVLSIVFHVAKASEADGSTSYIGGYNHEAAFSIVLATCFVIACFASGLRFWVRNAILVILLAGMLLANYRTSILAIAPLAFTQFNLDVLGRFTPRQRIILGVAILAISSIGAAAVAWMLRDRFLDLFTTLGSLDELMKRQMFYTYDERQLLSARPYIWSGYIYGWLDGGTKNLLAGFGPNSWVGLFPVYAHNTLVSSLYEYGVIGVVAISLLWVWMLVAALRLKDGPKGKLVAAHLSFFLLNMATMPHWMIEGNILYGIICGYTLYRSLGPATLPVAQTVAPKNRAPRPRLLSGEATDEPVPLASHRARIEQLRIKAGMTHGA
ncbi:MAG TPA: hypothetical protein VG742_04995 [Dongiaceae bacterium]|nr:hypothetical protein [Dongiaceae bacterium]